MQLYPTSATFHVAMAGAVMIAVGVAVRIGPAIAFGGGLLLTVALGRALAQSGITRLRESGFDMIWLTPKRVTQVARGCDVEIDAELRNRGRDTVRGMGIRAIASSMLEISVSPDEIILPGHSKTVVKLKVRSKRVGRWGIHGLSLEVRGRPFGGDGLYEVPLMFANPHGVETLPRAFTKILASPRGGRSNRGSDSTRPSRVLGDGNEFRELRELVPGDPFRKIAWKASARRGQLVVREMDRDERDEIFVVLDASVELWAGDPGHSPLDFMVDDASRLLVRHLTLGDSVGLVVFASRLRSWISPSTGPAHALALSGALASTANTVDEDRTELDEDNLARRVLEH